MFVAAILTTVLAFAQDAAWEGAWDGVDRLKTLDRETPAAQALVSELVSIARRRPEDPRAGLLAAQVGRWSPGDAGDILSVLETLPARELSVRECWLAAEVLPTGRVRTAVLLRALLGTSELTIDALNMAWRMAGEEALDLRLNQGARPIQVILDERYRAAWSAIDLSITPRTLGHGELADAILAEAIAQEEAAQRSTADLWSRRGVAAFGNGDEREARHYLGRALTRGSTDATLMLGLINLLAGRREAARMDFRTSILSDQPAAWALRGWGLTLLPEATGTR